MKSGTNTERNKMAAHSPECFDFPVFVAVFRILQHSFLQSLHTLLCLLFCNYLFSLQLQSASCNQYSDSENFLFSIFSQFLLSPLSLFAPIIPNNFLKIFVLSMWFDTHIKTNDLVWSDTNYEFLFDVLSMTLGTLVSHKYCIANQINTYIRIYCIRWHKYNVLIVFRYLMVSQEVWINQSYFYSLHNLNYNLFVIVYGK